MGSSRAYKSGIWIKDLVYQMLCFSLIISMLHLTWPLIFSCIRLEVSKTGFMTGTAPILKLSLCKGKQTCRYLAQSNKILAAWMEGAVWIH